MKINKIVITYQQAFRDDLNLSAEKYNKYQRFNNSRDLRYSLKLASDTIHQGALYLLDKNKIPFIRENGFAENTVDCLSLLQNKLNVKVTHKKELKNLIQIRNKLVHNRAELDHKAATNILDKTFSSLIALFEDFKEDILTCIDNHDDKVFIKRKADDYKLKIQREVDEESIFIGKDNYLDIDASVHDCPFCGEENSFYLKYDESTYHCSLCEVEDTPANCSECKTIWPSSLLSDFCDGYEDLCDECYEFHASKFK